MDSQHSNINLVPLPNKIQTGEGSFELTESSRIIYHGREAHTQAELLQDYLAPATGFSLPIDPHTSKDPTTHSIYLEQSSDDAPDEHGFHPEDYTLTVSVIGIKISSPSAAGLSRGIQSLRQLFPTEIFSTSTVQMTWKVDTITIEDRPSLKWRGMHIDVVRHFLPVHQLLRLIDLFALHKFNVLHIHLSDDQGWRVEIDQYPKLTEVGAFRDRTLIGHDRERPRQYKEERYGGFYSKKDIQSIIDFASRRHMHILPEIDMPGHLQSAIAAYPELGNLNHPIQVRELWGISQNILNLEDSTVDFMRNVIDEIIEMFPWKYIHIGGDEALKHEWSESPRAQERMKELGLHSEDECQSWFLGQVGSFIASKGRRFIGWDEILEGGLPSGASVMSWRGEEAGIKAANDGHDVVMAPMSYVYFDHYQTEPIAEEPIAIGGMTTCGKVYGYEPIHSDISPEKRHHVLGSQAQLWTEYMPDLASIERMAFPRACALSEALWTDASRKNYASFLMRMNLHRSRLDHLKVHAHPRP